jgi:hypothetical protein
MVHFVKFKSQLFSITEQKKGKVIYRVIVPSSELLKIIDDTTVSDCEELPMVSRPIEWEINFNGFITKFGGFLSNNATQYKAFFSPSYENTKAKLSKVNPLLTNFVSQISSVPYCINKTFYDFLMTLDDSPLSHSKPILHLSPHPNSKSLFKILNVLHGFNSSSLNSDSDSELKVDTKLEL